MKGEYAFCPKTGAELSETRHYDDDGRPRRAALSGEHALRPETEGELTDGALRSSATALLNYYRRCQDRHCDPDENRVAAAALALRRLKRTASGVEEWDVHVWYALSLRLSDRGHETAWMDAHTEPRCLACGSRLAYEECEPGVVRGRCPTNCTGDGGDRLPRIRRTIADLYRRAFGEEIETEDVLQFV